MLRVPIVAHVILSVACGLLSCVPALVYWIVESVRHSPHAWPRAPATGWEGYTAIALLVLGFVIRLLVPRFVVVARCPDCGGKARPSSPPKWRPYKPRYDDQLVYRCSVCGSYHPTGLGFGSD
jgi:hypothetical protein